MSELNPPEVFKSDEDSLDRPESRKRTIESVKKVAAFLGKACIPLVVAAIEYKIGTFGHDIWEEPGAELKECVNFLIDGGRMVKNLGELGLNIVGVGE